MKWIVRFLDSGEITILKGTHISFDESNNVLIYNLERIIFIGNTKRVSINLLQEE